MKLLTKSIREQLLRNGRIPLTPLTKQGEADADFLPVVKLFTPDAACTWLLTELDPEDPDIAFGLCDLGMGCPELGSVRISELESVRGQARPAGRARPAFRRRSIRFRSMPARPGMRRRLPKTRRRWRSGDCHADGGAS